MNSLPLYKKLPFYFKFFKRNSYLPNIEQPRTFNEKINHRKFFSNNPLFTVCADKIAVKDYVKNAVTEECFIHTIPTFRTTKSLTPALIKEVLQEHESFLIKANHNSGHIHFIDRSSNAEALERACQDLNHELTRDFGKRKNESWYSKIEPQILFEANIRNDKSRSLIDYKFHVFKQRDGSFKTILCVIFDRGNNPHCSYFDEDLNWIPISQGYPCIVTKFEPPANYQTMLAAAKKLAEPFSYVRVDLYNVDGQIYFGELTFADGCGFEKFSHYEHDLWLGQLWQGDPCN